MCFDFIGMQRFYLSLARGDAGPLAEALRERPSRRGRALGHVRPQPRRADPGQAHRGATPGGLRRLRPRQDMQLYGRGLRRRLPPMLDGDPPDPAGLQPAVLPARHAGALLRRGDRPGREPEGRGRDGRPGPDAVDRRPRGGFSTADPSVPGPLAEGGSGRSTSTSATSSRDPDSLLRSSAPRRATGVAGAGLGRPCAVVDPGRRPGRCSRTARTSTASPSSRCTTSPDAKVTATLPLTGLDGRDLYDVLAADGSMVTVGDDATLKLTLPPYGYRWLRSFRRSNVAVRNDAPSPSWATTSSEPTAPSCHWSTSSRSLSRPPATSASAAASLSARLASGRRDG